MPTDDPPSRLQRAALDALRLLPDDALRALTQGARLRRDALALARRSGPAPDPAAVRETAEEFRRARHLGSRAALTDWLTSRGSSPEDFARWIGDEALLRARGLSGDPVAPMDLLDLARVAEGTDPLWKQAVALAGVERPSPAPAAELIAGFFDERREAVPDDLDFWSRDRGFDDTDDLVRALRRRDALHPRHLAPPARSITPAVGDPAPDFALLDDDAGLVRADQLAGRRVLLAFDNDDDSAPLTPWAERAAQRLADRDVVVLLITRRPLDPPPLCPALTDRDEAVSQRFGLPRRAHRAVLLDPARRIEAIGLPDAVLEVALQPPEGAAEPQSQTALMAPVLLVPRAFSAEDCEALVERWSMDHGPGAVSASGGEALYDAGLKRRSDHVVTDPALDAMVRERLLKRVLPELLRAFHVESGEWEGFRVGCYSAEDGGHFGAHRDDANPSTAGRRFALTVNLRDDGYRGGDLRLPEYGATLRPPPGAALVYSASLLHEVTPVTEGRRFALVGFLRARFRAPTEEPRG